MPTDLDRLHTIVLRRPRQAGAGRTHASCWHAVGLLQTVPAGSDILWPIPRHDWLRHIRPMLAQVLAEAEIPVRWVRADTLKAPRSIWLYFVLAHLPQYGRGDAFYVDDFGESEEHGPGIPVLDWPRKGEAAW